MWRPGRAESMRGAGLNEPDAHRVRARLRRRRARPRSSPTYRVGAAGGQRARLVIGPLLARCRQARQVPRQESRACPPSTLIAVGSTPSVERLWSSCGQVVFSAVEVMLSWAAVPGPWTRPCRARRSSPSRRKSGTLREPEGRQGGDGAAGGSGQARGGPRASKR